MVAAYGDIIFVWKQRDGGGGREEGGKEKEGVARNELAKTYSTSPKKRRREFD